MCDGLLAKHSGCAIKFHEVDSAIFTTIAEAASVSLKPVVFASADTADAMLAMLLLLISGLQEAWLTSPCGWSSKDFHHWMYSSSQP
jgi:hypothetical protein